MSDSLRLETLSPGDQAAQRGFAELARRALEADGQPPFNDQAMAAARIGATRVHLIRGDGAALAEDGGAGTGTVDAETIARDASAVLAVLAVRAEQAEQAVLAAAGVTDGALELVVDPAHRRTGIGATLAARMLDAFDEPAPLLAWAHGDHPGARRLADRFGFSPVRTLLQLRMPLATASTTTTHSGGPDAPTALPAPPPDLILDTFHPGVDDDEWVALNAKVFAGHPEQGRLTADDLHARLREPWFDAADFLVARDSASGAMVGYNWLKVEPPEAGPAAGGAERIGEIYVIGVDPGSAGRGLGRLLMTHGLARLSARGCTVAALYVEEDNSAAVPLYRSLGFTDHTIDVQYARS